MGVVCGCRRVRSEHVCLGAGSRVCVCACVCGVRLRACLQQVDAAVVQQVGGALGGLLQQMVLVDDLDCLVVDAQPAVEPDVEDVSGVMATCRTVTMVIDNCGDTGGGEGPR